MSTPPGPDSRTGSFDVVDLSFARQTRQSAAWVCPDCDLVAARFTPTECAYLAAVHDQVQHGSRKTAQVVVGISGRVDLTAAPGLDAGLDAGLEAGLDADAGRGLGIGA